MSVQLTSLGPLVAALLAGGYRVVGPVRRDGAIVLAELAGADELPYGWGVSTGPGRYELRRRDDRAAFGHAAGPGSWKTFLHPPRTQVCSVDGEAGGGLRITEPRPDEPRYAFLGVRACDLHAIAVLDRVLGPVDRGYARRRARLFTVAVSCTEPAATCFCASAGQGPGVGAGADLVLTELAGGPSPRYLAEAGSPAGQRLLDRLPAEPAPAELVDQARAAVAAAAGRMRRRLPAGDLRELLAGAREAGRWDEVATRCLACANCTLVCPTCFCTTVAEVTDLSGTHAERWLRWDSCFDLDFSYLPGGPVRASTRSRYRQWLTHKLGTWHDQFGESGCVGCGRCIAWCPAGIDLTEEVAALAAGAGEAATPAAEAAADAAAAGARPGRAP
jgi:ferredoxin